MLKTFLPVFSIVYFLVASPHALSDTKDSVVLSNVHIINVTEERVEFNRDVFIASDTITKVRPHKVVNERHIKAIEETGKYLIPGLWDMHTHIRSYSGEENLPMFIVNGITGIRDLGITNHKLIKHWKNQILQTALAGPRIISSGVIIEGALPRFPSSISINKIEQVKPEIDKLTAQKVELIKLFQNIPTDIFTEIVRYAHKKGLKTSGHSPVNWTQYQAAEIQLDSIEHLFGISKTLKEYDHSTF